MNTIMVKGEWMAACGFPAVDTPMQVISYVTLPAGERMYKVIRPLDNAEWTVAEWRCKGNGY